MATDIATVAADGGIDLHFHPGQVRAWESRKRFVVVLGGRQSGKTSVGVYLLWREIQDCGPGDYLAVSPSFPLMNKKMLPEFLKLFETRLKLGYYKYADRVFEFTPTGVRKTCPLSVSGDEIRVYFGHGEDPDSLASATAKGAWLDEAGQARFRAQSWEEITARLAIQKGRAFLTTTPYQHNWLKSRLYDPWDEARKNHRSHPEIDVIQFDSTANPAFSRDEFERAERELPKWRLDMFYRGMFTKPAGMIYDLFEPAEHTTIRMAIPLEWPRYWGVDFGAVNCACVKLAMDPQTRRLYAYQAYWPASRRSVAEHVNALLADDVRPTMCIGGSKSENDWRQQFAAAGLSVNPPIISDVEAGIQAVRGLLAVNRLFLFSDLEDLVAEFQGYSRVVDDSGEPTADIESKETFHRLDATRAIAPWVAGHSGKWVPPPVMPQRNAFVPGQLPTPRLDLARRKGLFGLR